MIQDDITLEASLLKALSVKKNFDMFYRTLDTERLIPNTQVLLRDYKKYYDKYGDDIDWNVFNTEFTQNWHSDLDNSDIAYYKETVFPIVHGAEVSDNVYRSLLDRAAKHDISQLILNDFSEVRVHEILTNLASSKSMYEKNDTDLFKITDVDLSAIDSSNGVPWFLSRLQEGLGSLMGGQFVLFSADSGAGKSAFCISQAVHTLKQKLGRPILYCTSEDTKEDLVGRVLSNLFSRKIDGGFEEIVSNQEKVINEFKQNFDENMFIAMQIRSHRDLYKIQHKIAKHKPCLVIIDMLDILAENLDIISLTKLYNSIRGMANDGYPIIGTTQAGNTSYKDQETGEYRHRKHLTEKDTAGSKGGGKQGAAYCMIMAGIDDDIPGLRYLSTTKKKRGSCVNVTCELIDKFSLYREV